MLDQVQGSVASLTADDAYLDRCLRYHARAPSQATVIVPLRVYAVPSNVVATAPTQRDRHIQATAEGGRMAWQRDTGYNRRARVEALIGHWKQVIGDTLRFHTDEAQATEVAVAAEVLNRMLDLGRPNSVHVA